MNLRKIMDKLKEALFYYLKIFATSPFSAVGRTFAFEPLLSKMKKS